MIITYILFPYKNCKSVFANPCIVKCSCSDTMLFSHDFVYLSASWSSCEVQVGSRAVYNTNTMQGIDVIFKIFTSQIRKIKNTCDFIFYNLFNPAYPVINRKLLVKLNVVNIKLLVELLHLFPTDCNLLCILHLQQISMWMLNFHWKLLICIQIL